jgi:hypothetical protein
MVIIPTRNCCRATDYAMCLVGMCNCFNSHYYVWLATVNGAGNNKIDFDLPLAKKKE